VTGGAAAGPPVALFVYGSLRRGGVAHGRLAGCRFLRAGRIAGTLFDTGAGYPTLVLGGEGEAEGEIWEVPAPLLRALDRYEGVGEGLFRRVPVEVDGVECWTYVAGDALRERLSPAAAVPSGRWPAGT
jgi:gamma-glutamylcyclotransferase (GGCT)/AIG2-like uncharacterized protein YtfP